MKRGRRCPVQICWGEQQVDHSSGHHFPDEWLCVRPPPRVSTDNACTSKSEKQCDRAPRTQGLPMHLQCYTIHANYMSLNGLAPGSKLTKVNGWGLDVSLERPGVVHGPPVPHNQLLHKYGCVSPLAVVLCCSDSILNEECSVWSPILSFFWLWTISCCIRPFLSRSWGRTGGACTYLHLGT